MQGIPGSGKSSMAKLIADANPEFVAILSTDEYWYTQVGDDPTIYDYDPIQAGTAHRWNQRRCAEAMVMGDHIIIDNTNIKRDAIRPYLTLAEIFQYGVKVVRVEVALGVALARNSLRPLDRKVPDEVIAKMHKEMETLLS